MASLQTELIDLQENVALREVDCGTVTFWTKMVTAENFPSLQKVAICVLAMFGSSVRVCILSHECCEELKPQQLD